MPRIAHGVALAVAFAALLAYSLTLSPTVAWVNQGEDSGDLLVASVTLGIPHPTGYPLFTLLGRVASLLPLGGVAFRINLVAALAGALGVYLLALLVLELAAGAGTAAAILGAASAALVYAFSRGAWSQSVLAEVYSLNVAFLGAVLYCVARAERRRDPRFLALAAYLLGLGLTNHLLLLASLPTLALTAWRFRLRGAIGTAGVVLLPLLLLWGWSLVAYLPVRAGQGPEFSWGVPATPRQLIWVLTGAQYARNFFGRAPATIAAYLATGRWWTDFGPALFFLAAGFLAAVLRGPARLLVPGVTLLGSFFLLAAYAISDDVGYWMPVGFASAAIAGTGVAALWAWLGRAGWARAGLLLACAAAAAVGVARNASAVDASRDLTPYRFATRGLEAVEPDALILSEYDGRTFSLWFYKATQFAESRPRVIVIYKYLLVWPWYLQHLARTYPGLAVPPYQGNLDLEMNRLIARNLRTRPVYLVRRDPGLLPLFQLRPVGDPSLPLYRVTRKEEGG